MVDTATTIGWRGVPKDDARVSELRRYLEAHNGIKGLEILEPTDVDRAVQLFHRDGFVVLGDVLNGEQTDFLARGCNEVVREIVALDNDHAGNRGSHRYSFGGSSLTRSQLHRPEWQMLLDIPAITTLLTRLFGSPHYSLRAASGDFCLPGAVDYQRLHSDVSDWVDDKRTPFSAFHDPLGNVRIRDLPCPYICVNFLPQDVTRLNGPTRQIPGTQKSRTPNPRPRRRTRVDAAQHGMPCARGRRHDSRRACMARRHAERVGGNPCDPEPGVLCAVVPGTDRAGHHVPRFQKTVAAGAAARPVLCRRFQ